MKRRVPGIIKFDGDENTKWILVWHGRASYNLEKQTFEEELFFVTVSEPYYDFKSWGDKIYKTKRELYLSFIIPIGTIFNHLGHVIHYPSIQDFSKSYEVILSNEKGKKRGSLFEYFEDTKFSLIEEDVFEDINYFQGVITSKIRKNNINKNLITEFVFPPSSILKAFFNETIKELLKPDFWLKIINYYIKVEDEKKIGVLEYNPLNQVNGKLREKEVKELCRYLFTIDTQGKEMLFDITDRFKKPFHNQNNKSYLFCRLPYLGVMKFTVIGMFINNIEKETYIKNRFLVFDIVGGVLGNNENLVNLFEVQEDIHAVSKNQNNSTESKEDKDLLPYNKPIVDNNEHITMDLGDIEGTNATPIQNEIDPLMSIMPQINFNFIKREDQNFSYYPDNYYPVEINNFTQNTDISTTSTSQTIQFTNLGGENIHLSVLYEVLKRMKQEDFQIEIIKLENTHGNLSYPPISTNKPKILFIVQISKNGRYYCLVESYVNTSMVLMRYNSYNVKFNGSELSKVLRFTIENFDFSWSHLYRNKRLEKVYGIKLFQPMDHNLYFRKQEKEAIKQIDTDKMIDKLYTKLVKLKLEKDLEDKYF
ncbi:hypothetical protein [Apibacter sp. B2912]|uniref:hypothetical protein n=1 Tax=Apibacter sp. B2912 TaxID=2656763 RepID=UPI001369C6D8|nr:hypothetical protein [Apibacter sp. B2912]MXO31611.1 hypothetical protein [Apibacter sp. B2912]